jgi:hypothetical protein
MQHEIRLRSQRVVGALVVYWLILDGDRYKSGAWFRLGVN